MVRFLFILLFLGLCKFEIYAQYYNIQQITGTGSDYNYQTQSNTIISTGNQVLSNIQNIPFNFTFYGQNVTSYIASDNGYITFDTTTSSNPNNISLPSPNAPTNAIFAFWDDINLAAGTSVADKVVNFTYGTPPNRVHVIQWHSVTPVSGTGYLYAAIRIYESPCGIDFDVIHLYGNATGMTATVGCQNFDASDGSQTIASPNEDYPGTSLTNSDDIVYNFSIGNYDYDLSVINETNINDVANVSSSIPLDIEILNSGNQTINSFDLNYTINNGVVQTNNINTNLLTGNSSIFSHNMPFMPSTAGQYYELKIWADNINGYNDELNCNDTITKKVWVNLGITGTKKVLLEEFTTEACQFCPDGTYIVEQIANQNDYVIPVAHHAGFGTDFLTTSFHESYAEDMTSGAPKACIDRYDFTKDGSKVAISRSNNGWLDAVIEMNSKATPVNISIDGTSYNELTNTVSAEVNLNFVDYAQPGNLALTLWVIEDSIAPISQTNYYSGNSSHPYGNLPSTITAANSNEYQHRHTTKKIRTSFWGDPIGITNPVPGDTYQRIFNNIPLSNTDPGQVYLVATISYNNNDITDRLVLNTNKKYIEGMVNSISNFSHYRELNIFPNPLKDIGTIEFQINTLSYVKLTVYNSFGKKVIDLDQRKYSSGKHAITFKTSKLKQGTYIAEIKTNKKVEKIKFSVIQ